MSLRARVEDFIAHRADRDELIQLLAECTQAHDTEALLCVRRLAEDMYGGFTFNFEPKASAAWELACWGDAGISQLAEATRANPTSKNLSLCAQILCVIASGSIGTPVFATTSQIDRLRRMVGTDASVASCARRSLLELVLSMENDEDLIDLAGKGFGPAGMLEPASAREMFAAMSMRWLTMSVPLVARYRGLLADHSDDEPTFQRFFSTYPEMLDPMVVDVWAQPDLHGARKPDFVLRRSDGSYLVVEIETPGKSIVTRLDQLSAQASHAVAQVSEYKRFLERLPNSQVHFPAMDEVTCLVVIGLEGELGPSQMQALETTTGSVTHSRSSASTGWQAVPRRCATTWCGGLFASTPRASCELASRQSKHAGFSNRRPHVLGSDRQRYGDTLRLWKLPSGRRRSGAFA